MLKINKAIIVASCLLMVSAVSYGASDWLKGSTEQQLKTLAEIQPGLGTVMIEYGNRITTMYYAAKGGNWDMAAYQLKEAREIQEVGENTRPGRAAGLKSFEAAHLDKLDAAIKAKNWKEFEGAFGKAVKGCNGCHATEGFPFIKYELPKASISPTSVKP